jgi:SAM-dependent methyltransferase
MLEDKYADLDFIRDIATNDEMCMSTPENYFRFGLAALELIRVSLEAVGNSDPENILDLPSGHGRVLRMLRAAYPDARLTACDLNRDAVDYCASIFGAIPAYSTEDPSEIDLGSAFDLIWCGSLLTHLDADRWSGFLSMFERHLAPGGVVVFTVNGRVIREEVESGRRRFRIQDSGRSLVRGYGDRGFAFEPYLQSGGGYGISVSSPAWVCRELEKHPLLMLAVYREGAWNGRQDAVACVRAAKV